MNLSLPSRLKRVDDAAMRDAKGAVAEEGIRRVEVRATCVSGSPGHGEEGAVVADTWPEAAKV